DFVNDVGTYYFQTFQPTAIQMAWDTIYVTVFNDGSAPQTGFSVGYLCRFNPSNSGSVTYTGTLAPGQNDVVKIPAQFTFLGLDTLVVYTSLPGDGNQLNDTTRVAFNVYPVGTMVGCGFNGPAFPPSRNSSFYPPVPGPSDWTRTIISGTMNWARATSASYPTCSPLEGGGFAHYNNYSASTGSAARLATHRFNIGPNPQDVIVNFWFFQTSNYSTYYDSLFLEYSLNGTTWITKQAWRCYDPANPGWNKKSVNIGSFPGNTNLWVGFRTWSNYYHQTNIDSVMVTLAPPSAAVNDVGVDKIYGIPAPAFTGTNYPITVRIRNYGLGAQNGPFPVSYNPGDGSGVVTESWSGYLGPLDTCLLYTS
ncbi:MAG: hypothetical protein N2748_02975, partial [candidate division WOR-3 bacterium]|nr:hypothetical protein [candidate division WOR-3 bacterium]